MIAFVELLGGSLLCVLVMAAVVLLLPMIWVIGMYNGLVRLRNACKESWADIDTELRRRYDLIPNLVTTVKAYAKHERDTLERVTAARNTACNNHGTPTSQAHDENQLVGALGKLFAVSEAYPDLKADRHFLELQDELTNTEDRIARARRFYNANVRDLNNRVHMFPSNLIANLFGFKEGEYFDIEDPAARRPVSVDV